MPKPGQKSITVPDETNEYLREVFARHEKQLKREGIRSIPQLVHKAVSHYAGELGNEEGEDSYRSLVEFFEKNPDLLKRLGFQSAGQLIEAALRGPRIGEQVVKNK